MIGSPQVVFEIGKAVRALLSRCLWRRNFNKVWDTSLWLRVRLGPGMRKPVGFPVRPCNWALGLSPVRMPRLVRAKMACGHHCSLLQAGAAGVWVRTHHVCRRYQYFRFRIPTALARIIPRSVWGQSARTMPQVPPIFAKSRNHNKACEPDVTGWLASAWQPSGPGRAHRYGSRSSGYGDHDAMRIAYALGCIVTCERIRVYCTTGCPCVASGPKCFLVKSTIGNGRVPVPAAFQRFAFRHHDGRPLINTARVKMPLAAFSKCPGHPAGLSEASWRATAIQSWVPEQSRSAESLNHAAGSFARQSSELVTAQNRHHEVGAAVKCWKPLLSNDHGRPNAFPGGVR